MSRELKFYRGMLGTIATCAVIYIVLTGVGFNNRNAPSAKPEDRERAVQAENFGYATAWVCLAISMAGLAASQRE